MSEKETLNDKQFDSTVKSIIQRDYFPTLKQSKNNPQEENEDKSTKHLTVSTFCEKYAPESDAKFIQTVERDRMILQNSAPAAKLNKKLENDSNNPYGRQKFSALFYEPPKLNIEPKKSLTYEKEKRKPTINPKNTRFNHDPMIDLLSHNHFHLFTTESSSTESESEFEGRTHYRDSLLQSMRAPVTVNQEKIRKCHLSEQGMNLLSRFQNQT